MMFTCLEVLHISIEHTQTVFLISTLSLCFRLHAKISTHRRPRRLTQDCLPPVIKHFSVLK